MPFVQTCEITHHHEVARAHYRMVLQSPEIAGVARPGQFCMLQVQQGLYPFLRRPMSIERIFNDSISILFKVEGEGTQLLSRLSAGQVLNVQGPLGNGFTLDARYDRHIIVGGGIGVAPFPALAEAIKRDLGKTPEVVIAARTGDILLCEREFHQMGCKVWLATDDGSAGKKAFASEVLRELAPDSETVVYACGPMAMMRATHELCAELGATCFASLEAEMACGDGVCLGCVVEAKVEIEAERMVRVCKDGPVFDTKIINWSNY